MYIIYRTILINKLNKVSLKRVVNTIYPEFQLFPSLTSTKVEHILDTTKLVLRKNLLDYICEPFNFLPMSLFLGNINLTLQNLCSHGLLNFYFYGLTLPQPVSSVRRTQKTSTPQLMIMTRNVQLFGRDEKSKKLHLTSLCDGRSVPTLYYLRLTNPK